MRDHGFDEHGVAPAPCPPPFRSRQISTPFSTRLFVAGLYVGVAGLLYASMFPEIAANSIAISLVILCGIPVARSPHVWHWNPGRLFMGGFLAGLTGVIYALTFVARFAQSDAVWWTTCGTLAAGSVLLVILLIRKQRNLPRGMIAFLGGVLIGGLLPVLVVGLFLAMFGLNPRISPAIG